ncbi:MAG: nitrous oxide reductase accessory protein NosL [Nitrospiraceae bacterium]|nr:nitrous oxide reductase accessory protein NosL [Nitrospiraceae bacterium]
MKRFSFMIILVLLASSSFAAGQVPAKPSHADKCPVCGMFVYKYPDWTASLRLADGTTLYFDGAKDLFAFLFDASRYRPGTAVGDIKDIFVKDYYSLSPVDGRTAWYVAGSDVFGPMGRELIPFAKESDAREFRKDHGGLAPLPFSGVTPATLQALK